MSGFKILVVDDDPDIRALIESYLRPEGYELSFAQDGLTCLTLAQRERPDLILLDLGLPAGDGITVLHRLHKILPLSRIPVLVITARSPGEWKDVSLQSAATSFLQKPVDRDTLLSKVRECLGVSVPQVDPFLARCPQCGCELTAPSSIVREDVIQGIVAEVTRAVLSRISTPVSASCERESQRAEVAANRPTNESAVGPGPGKTRDAGQRHGRKLIQVKSALKSLVPQFIERRRADCRALAEALDGADFGSVAIIGHRMRGNGAGLGFEEITAIGGALETAAERRDRDEIGRQLRGLRAYLESIDVVYEGVS